MPDPPEQDDVRLLREFIGGACNIGCGESGVAEEGITYDAAMDAFDSLAAALRDAEAERDELEHDANCWRKFRQSVTDSEEEAAMRLEEAVLNLRMLRERAEQAEAERDENESVMVALRRQRDEAEAERGIQRRNVDDLSALLSKSEAELARLRRKYGPVENE